MTANNILLTTSVGSFGKPDYLQKARNAHARGKLGATELLELERKATAEWITIQEEIGLDILVDGEMYRGDMVAYFADLLDGYSEGGLVRSYGNRYYHKPVISGKVARRRSGKRLRRSSSIPTNPRTLTPERGTIFLFTSPIR